MTVIVLHYSVVIFDHVILYMCYLFYPPNTLLYTEQFNTHPDFCLPCRQVQNIHQRTYFVYAVLHTLILYCYSSSSSEDEEEWLEISKKTDTGNYTSLQLHAISSYCHFACTRVAFP